jgi:hypothetical protein
VEYINVSAMSTTGDDDDYGYDDDDDDDDGNDNILRTFTPSHSQTGSYKTSLLCSNQSYFVF